MTFFVSRPKIALILAAACVMLPAIIFALVHRSVPDDWPGTPVDDWVPGQAPTATGLQEFPNIKLITAQCINDVQANGGKKSNIKSDFDAYLNNDDVISSIGTKREVFEFKKCLVEMGVPISSE
jgi:hypothetical protein